jgi:DNA-binding winged helix-turn-helix (wHTH) protein
VPLQCYRFGDFELDCARFELRRNGHPLRLERIPMELLILLAGKGGDVVTRQEISEKLWGKEVFVDTEHGINTAIRKVRSALQEDADQPHFIQTVPGKGYRFVAQLKDTDGNGKSGKGRDFTVAETPPAHSGHLKRRNWRRAAIAALVLLLLAGSALVLNPAGGYVTGSLPGTGSNQSVPWQCSR